MSRSEGGREGGTQWLRLSLDGAAGWLTAPQGFSLKYSINSRMQGIGNMHTRTWLRVIPISCFLISVPFVDWICILLFPFCLPACLSVCLPACLFLSLAFSAVALSLWLSLLAPLWVVMARPLRCFITHGNLAWQSSRVVPFPLGSLRKNKTKSKNKK